MPAGHNACGEGSIRAPRCWNASPDRASAHHYPGHPLTIEASVADSARLGVSELVTNAILHGAPPVTVRVTASADVVRVEVEDTGTKLPIRLRAGGGAMTGRGLGLVAVVSTQLWHQTFLDASLADLPAPPRSTSAKWLAANNGADR